VADYLIGKSNQLSSFKQEINRIAEIEENAYELIIEATNGRTS